MEYSALIPTLLEISQKASEKILSVYNDASLFSQIEEKADHSPLTLADKCSNEVIIEGLKKLTPDIPIISEEGKNIPYEERKNYNIFWLVDPLDGTKEFIKRNGQFTVNIALIEGTKPIIGIIQIPVTSEIYYADSKNAYKFYNNKHIPISVSNKKSELTAIGSSSHASENEVNFLSKFPISNHVKAGSSLKFCLVAEGKAEIYYREGPTMEWDTAAGHAIVEQAGGKVEGLTYNKPDLLNGSFCCYGFKL